MNALQRDAKYIYERLIVVLTLNMFELSPMVEDFVYPSHILKTLQDIKDRVYNKK